MNKIKLLEEIIKELLEASDELYASMKEEMLKMDSSPAYRKVLDTVLEYTDAERGKGVE